MTRKLKDLGLALVAVTALSAMAVTTAHAGEFDIGANPAVITGQTDATVTLSFGSGSILCHSASFEGTSQGQTVNELTLTPTLSCTAYSAQMNGCKYTITGAQQPSNTALFDIVGCTSGKQIKLQSVIGCTIDIPEQSGFSHTVATNITGNKVTLQMTVTGLTATQTGAGCPNGNEHHSTDLSITGSTTVEALQYLGNQQITKHGHQYQENIRGTQLSLVST